VTVVASDLLLENNWDIILVSKSYVPPFPSRRPSGGLPDPQLSNRHGLGVAAESVELGNSRPDNIAPRPE
jgi:hypothetical protein